MRALGLLHITLRLQQRVNPNPPARSPSLLSTLLGSQDPSGGPQRENYFYHNAKSFFLTVWISHCWYIKAVVGKTTESLTRSKLRTNHTNSWDLLHLRPPAGKRKAIFTQECPESSSEAQY